MKRNAIITANQKEAERFLKQPACLTHNLLMHISLAPARKWQYSSRVV